MSLWVIRAWHDDVLVSFVIPAHDEELLLARRLRKQGRYVSVPSAVVTSGRKLRTYSFWEMSVEIGKLFVGGTRRLKKRERLDMWYGPRREDPWGGERKAKNEERKI